MILPVEKKACTLGPMSEPPDPGVFIGKTPGLEGGAAWVVQAGRGDLTVDFRLSGQIIGMQRAAVGIHG